MIHRPFGLAAAFAAAVLTAGFQAEPAPIDLPPALEALTGDAKAARDFDYMALKAGGTDLEGLRRAVYRRAAVADNDPRCLTDGEAVLEENLAAAHAAANVAAFEDDRAVAAEAWSKWTLFEEGLAHGQLATDQPFKSVSDRYAAAEIETTARARELLRRTAADQALRHAVGAGEQVWGPLSDAVRGRVMSRLWLRVCHIDRSNTAWLKADVEANGWYLISATGERASGDAWLMAQHADRDRDFQRHVLALMEPLVVSGEVSRNNYAYLWDRIAVFEKRPQRYGTQGGCVAVNRWEPDPIEDPDRVEALREEAEIGSLAEYQTHMHSYCANFTG